MTSVRRVVALVSMLAFCSVGCTIEGRCGTWKFNRKAYENLPVPRIRKTISGQDVFLEYRAKCCECSSIRFIQVARTKVTRGSTVTTSSPAPARATADGWSLDQGRENPKPFYCTGPDGQTADDFGTPGRTGGEPAKMHDSPHYLQPMHETQKWEFLTAAVCERGGEVCTGKILDTLYWTFTIESDGSVEEAHAAPAAGSWDEKAFDDAVSEWNRQASSGAPAMAGQEPAPPLHR